MGKKISLVLVGLLLIGGGALLYLNKTGYWSKENVSLRKLDSLEIPVSTAQARSSIDAGDSEILELLGHAKVDFNAAETRSENGDTLLHSALKNKDWASFDKLVSFKADPNALDSAKLPVTSYLMENGETKRAEALFSAGADVNIPHSSGESALIHYVKSDQLDKAFTLLDSKATPDTFSTSGESVLYLSLQNSSEKLRRSLLGYGADPNGKAPNQAPVFTDFCKNVPSLNYSSHEAQSVIKDFIEKGVDLNATDEKGWRPLQWLIHHRMREAAELIIAADPNVEDTLWVALNERDYPSASRLLELKADPNQPNSDGETPLMKMIHANRADMVTELLSYGVDIEQDGKEGQSALVTAIALKHSDSALALLRNPSKQAKHSRVMAEPVTEEYRILFGKRGYFDWYCRNCPGLTPLMAAVMMKELAVAEQLIANGADKVQGTTSRYKVYPIQMAAKNKDVKMQQLLIGVSYKDEDQVRKFVVDLSEQSVKYYNNGELKKTSRISSGQSGFRTQPGSYVITDKTRHKRSNIYDGASMPYFQRFSCGAIGFHYGITSSRYASHGCIRLPMSTAKYFWGQTSLGDRVEIVK